MCFIYDCRSVCGKLIYSAGSKSIIQWTYSRLMCCAVGPKLTLSKWLWQVNKMLTGKPQHGLNRSVKSTVYRSTLNKCKNDQKSDTGGWFLYSSCSRKCFDFLHHNQPISTLDCYWNPFTFSLSSWRWFPQWQVRHCITISQISTPLAWLSEK